MKRKVVSVLLIGAMAASLLAGCGGSGDSKGSGDSSSAGKSGDEYSSEIDMDEDPYTVAIQVVTLPGAEVENEEEIEAAINEITEPAINCDVDLQFVWISELTNTTSMGIAGDEKLDIVAVSTVQPLSSMVGSDMLIDLNEGNLLQNRGTDYLSLFDESVVEAGSVDGRQLAVPAKLYTAAAKGIIYNKTVADAAGVTIGESITMDELEDALYAIHDSNPDIMSYYLGTGENNFMQWLYNYEAFGSEASYGAIMDSSKSTEIENLFATDVFKDYCLRMYKWRQDGIIQKDSTDDTTAQSYFGAGQLFCAVISINPEQEVSWASEDFETATASLVDAQITNSLVTEYMWGIASNCERPDKAMDLLNLIYSNADVANLIQYGVEGSNYDFAEGSDSIIVANGTYDPMFYYAGNTPDMYIQSPADESYNEELASLEASATISPIISYMFDDTDYQTESSVIYSTIMEYLPTLQNGMYDSEDAVNQAIEDFNAKLESSGINDVIAANQEQLDAYLAEQ